jgi:hypothetical protein
MRWSVVSGKTVQDGCWWAWWMPEICRVLEIKSKIIQLHLVRYIYTYRKTVFCSHNEPTRCTIFHLFRCYASIHVSGWISAHHHKAKCIMWHWYFVYLNATRLVDWYRGYGATTPCLPRPWASRPFVRRHLVPSVIPRGAICQATPGTSVSEERKWARNVR